MREIPTTVALLSCGVAVHGLIARTVPSAPPKPLDETSSLLKDIREHSRDAHAAPRAQSEPDASIAAIDRIDSFFDLRNAEPVFEPRSMVGEHPCDEPASVYLSTNAALLFHDSSGDDQCDAVNSVAIEVAGNYGAQEFTFTSGTPMGIIIKVINTFADQTGVSGAVAADNDHRIELRSTETGSDQFVTVTVLDERLECLSIVCQDEFSDCAFEATDFGESGLPGDVTCDQIVDVADMLFVLKNWGACPSGNVPCPGDANFDGVVNVTDLLLVLGNWSE